MMAINYRESYGMHISNGILFNHEGPRRGETFVTRKITRALTRIKLGLQDKLVLGNLSAKRDWGYAPDFVRAMWLMLQQPSPDDYVIATGESHSVAEWLKEAAWAADIGSNYMEFVETDLRYLRPAEVDHLQGSYYKAHEKLGWTPSVRFGSLVSIMVDHDMALARKELAAK